MSSPILPETGLSTGKAPVNILLVDDEPRNLDVLESVLALPGYRLVRVQTAQEALMALLEEEFAAIVLDIQMPGMNGIELAHLIKQRKRTRHIPIIFLTAYFHEDKDILQGYEVGAVDYLTKPVDPQILKSKIGVFAELFRKTRELIALNRAMGTEITQRQTAQEGLRQAKDELESRVEERTRELTRAIEDLRAGEQRYRQLAAIVESSTDAIISQDLNGIITTWNRGAERLFGYPAGEVVGKPISVLAPAECRHGAPAIIERIRRGERVEDYETVRRRKDGGLVEVSLTVSPIRDALNRVIGASKIVRDITGRKQAARNLARAHHEAVAASRAKDDFLAALSHELRTPLNPALLLASEAAEDPRLPAEVRGQFSAIRKNVELEARLIDDLLDMTRIRHGKLSLSLGLVEVHALLQEAFETVRSEFERKSIALTMALEAKPSAVMGDAVRLQQVFWNVFRNAVKFTSPDGKVALRTRVETGTGELIITITDTGVGMTAAELARAFEAFAQGDLGDGEGARRFGGLGLGLAISRTLVELHSGSIRASSAGRDQGSTFTIALPLASGRAGVEQSSGVDSLRTRDALDRPPGAIHILLVEDHEPTRAVLAQLLTRRRYQVRAAASIAEARALARKYEFQLLISDIGLPDGDGFELMKELRARNQQLQGIALTGYGMDRDIARSLEAGFAHHLVKPVRVESLERALASVVAGTPQA
jgi:PAS domain S-box-containing protein